MLRVDNWLDVASLENMEEDHSFMLLKKNLMKIFFFFWIFWKSWIFSRNWKFLLMIFFFFWKQPKKYKPNAPSPKALLKISFFFFFFFFERFRKNWLFIYLFFCEGIENFDWWTFFFFLKILNFLKELKILVDEIFILFYFILFFEGIENFDWWFFYYFIILLFFMVT